MESYFETEISVKKDFLANQNPVQDYLLKTFDDKLKYYVIFKTRLACVGCRISMFRYESIDWYRRPFAHILRIIRPFKTQLTFSSQVQLNSWIPKLMMSWENFEAPN